jgi:hypothetical protein
MKIVGRILMILAAFALVMGIICVAVNAGSTGNSSNAPEIGPGKGGFGGTEGVRPEIPNAERPEFPGGERGDIRGERDGGGWIFGAIKNIRIERIIVPIIVLPKGWLQKRKRTEQVAVE